jgi:hypothetical protein
MENREVSDIKERDCSGAGGDQCAVLPEWQMTYGVPANDAMRAYLAVNILKLYFPHFTIYNALLMKNGSAPSDVIFANKIDWGGLLRFDKNSCMVSKVPFNCLKGGCEINVTSVIKDEDSSRVTKFFGHELKGFEKVFLVSLLLDRFSIKCDNFALKITCCNVSTRFVSFKDNFVSISGAEDKSRPLLYEKILSKYDHYVKEKGKEEIDNVIQTLKDIETNVFIKLYRHLPPDFMNKLDPVRTIEAIDEIISGSRNFESTIDKVMNDLIMIYGEQTIMDSLSLKYSVFVEYRDKEPSADNIASYVKELIQKRLQDLKELQTCIKVEKALKENDVDAIEELSHDEVLLMDPICISFYKYPKDVTPVDLDNQRISKIAQVYGYSNDAADAYNEFWERGSFKDDVFAIAHDEL